MASTLLHKRSATTGDIPTTAQLSLGELAINTFDGKLFTKKNVSGSESIVEIGASAGGSGTLSAKCAATGNQALSGGTAFPTIDGVATTAGDFVLLMKQTAASANGLYVVGGTSTAWTLTRATTMDTAAEAAAQQVLVQSGTTYGGKTFDTTFKSTDTLGTTAMVWNEIVAYKGGGNCFIEFDQTISEDATVPANKNWLTAGPVTVATGKTVTVSTGATWVVV